MKTYSRFIPCDTGKQINVEYNCLCLLSSELPFSDIYLKLWSTKKINCNWASKIDHIYKLTTVTIIKLNFPSPGRGTWSSVAAKEAGFVLSHVSCSIVLANNSLHLFISLFHLYKLLSFFLTKRMRNPFLSNLFPTATQNNQIFVTPDP